MLNLSLVTPVFAQGPQPWQNLNPECVNDGVATIQGIACLITNVFSVAITMLGLVIFVMFLVGSFYYLLSGGNAQTVEKAKKTFTFAVVGLIVALSAFIILNLIAVFTGIDLITKFVIPSSNN